MAMNLQIDQNDLQRLEKLANREGKAVEDLAAEIFHQALADRDPNSTWLDDVSGSFENDSEFDQVVRLGRELRKADRPNSGE
jgi:hypothetical protein